MYTVQEKKCLTSPICDRLFEVPIESTHQHRKHEICLHMIIWNLSQML